MSALTLFLGALLGATASANEVLWYANHEGYPRVDGLETLEEAMRSAGADTFWALEATWPGDLSAYRVILLAPSTTHFDSEQVAALQGFMADGGVLVVISDYYSASWPEVAQVMDSLVAQLGYASGFTDDSYDETCSYRGEVVAEDHPLTRELDGLEYAASADLVMAGSGRVLIEGEAGQGIVGAEERLVLVSDAGVFGESCDLALSNVTFFQNLFDLACDLDGDGAWNEWCGGLDCEDADPGLGPPAVWYLDYDRDGYGLDETATEATCEPPEDHVLQAGDCDDYNAEVHPDAEEVCDGIDNDCDGDADGGAVDAPTWYPDEDGDSFGDAEGAVESCERPEGYLEFAGDCDDTDPEKISQETDCEVAGAESQINNRACGCAAGGRGGAWPALLPLLAGAALRRRRDQRISAGCSTR